MHTDAHITDSRHQSMHHSHICSKCPMFTSILRALWSLPHKNSTPSRRWQPLAWAKRRSPRLFFRVAQRWQTASCRSLKDSAQTRHQTRRLFHTAWHASHTDNTTDTDNTCPPEMGLPLIVKWAHFSFPTTLKWAAWLSFFGRPPSGRKHCLKMKG